MYSIKGKQAARIEPVTFSELNMTENDIEEILRNSIDMICDEEESMLIVGRQVRNEKNGRSDLTAVELKAIADVLGVKFEQAFILPDGDEIKTSN